MSRETSRGRRPFKVWDCSRVSRKALVVASLEELIVRGREKLGVGVHESVRAVLETDGTQVDDSEYFRSLPDNTVFLLLRPGERWCPAGVDVIRAALSSIPKIVCEAISCLDLQDEVPSWKIMENRGRITIVLTWDQRPPAGASIYSSSHPTLASAHRHDAFARHISPSSLSPMSLPPAGPLSPHLPTSSFQPLQVGAGGKVGGGRMGIRTMITKDGKLETVINDFGPKPPTITVISHEDPPYDSVPRASRSSVPPPLPPHHGALPPGHSNHHYQYGGRGLPRQGSSSLESATGGPTAPVHVHTVECSQRGHFPPQHPPHGPGGRGSPPEPSYCDFHCCALHEEGRKIQVHKAVATSPIQEPGLDAARMAGGPGPSSKSLHVRFMGVADDKNNGRYVSKKMVPSSLLGIPLSLSSGPGGGGGVGPSSIIHPDLGGGAGGEGTTTESSESETENNVSVLEEEAITTQKFLLLIDQLSLDQKRHLSIKDIGVILERLSSKIIDVERLDRESEADDCYNWTIKATIRGDVLRELGVIYNGNYYAISEHPSYNTAQQSSGSSPSRPPPAPQQAEDDEDMRL